MWTPGQVLEALVGFDSALMAQHALFWSQVGFSRPPPGAPPLPTWWPFSLARLSLRVRRPPSFSLNLFLQYKRPERLEQSNSSQWSEWKRSYYRFSTSRHQQKALDACATSLGQRGLVAYASPVFHTRTSLFHHTEKGTLVQNTHFVPVLDVTGHRVYSYVSATGLGKAHSKVVEVKPLQLGGGSNGEPPRLPVGLEGAPPDDIFRQARLAAEAAVRTSPTIVGSMWFFLRRFARARRILARTDPDSAQEQPVEDFLYVSTFCAMSNLGWVMLETDRVGRPSSQQA